MRHMQEARLGHGEHRVQMSEPKHDIENSDIDFWIHAGDKQLGHLHINRGGIDWYKGKSRVNKHWWTWEAFRDLMESRELVRARKPKRKRK